MSLQCPCGMRNAPGGRFCAHCGAPLPGASPVPINRHQEGSPALLCAVLAALCLFGAWFAYGLLLSPLATVLGFVALILSEREPDPTRRQRAALGGLVSGLVGAGYTIFLLIYVAQH